MPARLAPAAAFPPSPLSLPLGLFLSRSLGAQNYAKTLEARTRADGNRERSGQERSVLRDPAIRPVGILLLTKNAKSVGVDIPRQRVTRIHATEEGEAA